jgi:hypothetical protein
MNDSLDTSTDGLIDEIARYLAAVDVFRAEGREPSWRPEHRPDAARLERFSSDPREHRRVH